MERAAHKRRFFAVLYLKNMRSRADACKGGGRGGTARDQMTKAEKLLRDIEALSSTLRILSGEAEGFGESIPKFDGNFHAVWALPGH
jgi:hypothetical protein